MATYPSLWLAASTTVVAYSIFSAVSSQSPSPAAPAALLQHAAPHTAADPAAVADHDAIDTTPALRTSTGSKPHVVFVLVDDAGYNDLGPGSSDLSALTPNLNALAADGVSFTSYYAQPYCTPSRAALLTGKLPVHCGMQHGLYVFRRPAAPASLVPAPHPLLPF